MQNLLLDLKVAARESLYVLAMPGRMIQGVTAFVLFVITLQWLFQPQTFWSIITNSALSVSDKLDVIIDGFFAVFQLIDDFTPIAFILIALFQSLSLMLYLQLRTIIRSKSRRQLTSLGLGLLGSGCVACGGSVLSPALAAVATNISVSAAQAVGDVVLFGAILFSIRAWRDIALQYAHESRKA